MNFPGEFTIRRHGRHFRCVPCTMTTFMGSPSSGFSLWEDVGGGNLILIGRQSGSAQDAIELIDSLVHPRNWCLFCEY